MSFFLSWWAVALLVSFTSPLWIRALTQRWERMARARTASLVARLEHDTMHGDDSARPGP